MELQTTWFILWGLLWAIFFMTDGFDFGVGTLYPFLGKSDIDRRMMINSVGPLWDGNEVWLITAGGVTFAAFPKVYAVMFSTLYAPLLLILFALILRGVAFEFRGQIHSEGWKRIWDACIFIGSAAPALLFGVAFANIFRGIPFDANGLYHGNLLMLLNPYGILGGALFLVLFMLHGANWLAIKTTGDLHDRSVATAGKLWLAVVPLAVLFLVASFFATSLYDNYFKYPALFLVIIVTVAALLGVRYFIAKQYFFRAWFASAVTIVGATFFGIAGLFPTLYPSLNNPGASLTAFNASSSPLTLKIMLTVVLIFLPLVIAYQIWAYNLFKGKLTKHDLEY
ncbi:CydB2 [Desulforapulum autotrophicum HRM2]|uniref:CydB2 n=1 Tax=Desulforapulum autotrophicum (strain ATCC 43914 / DSM 3382 / VKM B-1955 / HRM2) TaxID=177437 RepID=C0QCB3_DESAH|nr:cytochrome d ubiquinol oxidase subunit II [Desulforapulum autotrophicum]ACN17130.1 CydB2 [Desulforapulum autotrophicum HRM2]